MMYELSQSFFFEAAHTLQRKVEREASLHIHGHTYHAEVSVAGFPDPNTGMVIDLGLLRAEIRRVRDKLDHCFLDDLPMLGPATLENLCRYIYCEIRDTLPQVMSVVVERRASGDRCALRPGSTVLDQAIAETGAHALLAATSADSCPLQDSVHAAELTSS